MKRSDLLIHLGSLSDKVDRLIDIQEQGFSEDFCIKVAKLSLEEISSRLE